MTEVHTWRVCGCVSHRETGRSNDLTEKRELFSPRGIVSLQAADQPGTALAFHEARGSLGVTSPLRCDGSRGGACHDEAHCGHRGRPLDAKSQGGQTTPEQEEQKMELLSRGCLLSLLSRRFTDTSQQTWGLGPSRPPNRVNTPPTHGTGLGISRFPTDGERQL